MWAHSLYLLVFVQSSLAALYYPNLQASLLEHILVDNWGAYASNFSSAITPCDNYVTEVGLPAVNSGRTTAAQWIRVLFHDAITANVTAGTGGVDASIGFETLRSENAGSAMNDSFTFWRPFVNDAVSMADLVALGTVMSMSICGGENVPYRPGRIDATGAGGTGVPAPETNLQDTLGFFSRAGFNKQDAIKLTACGHTMGSVHHGGFPDVVPDSYVTANNTNGGANFDLSRAAFDPKVVHEYVEGTGNRGGPLVTTTNFTTQSDLRLYESDGNTTMQSLYNAGEGFQSICVDIMGRLMNTIPSGVSLKDPITPLSIKPINVTYDFDSSGKLFLSGKIRTLTSQPILHGSSIQFSLSNSFSTNLTAEVGKGSSVYGTTTYFPFSIPSTHLLSLISNFKIHHAGNEIEIPLQNNMFIVPSLTSISGTVVTVTVAARPGQFSKSSAVSVSAPVGQLGTLGPKIVHNTVSLAKTSSEIDGYEIWNGSIDLRSPVTGAVTVELGAVDTLVLSAGVAGW